MVLHSEHLLFCERTICYKFPAALLPALRAILACRVDSFERPFDVIGARCMVLFEITEWVAWK